MKTEQEIRKQLQQVYQHRFLLRLERKTKRTCKNCKFGICKEFDLGDFGTVSKWTCKDGKSCGLQCGFNCAYTIDDIQNQIIKDISDPSICGAKQPKIAMLLWVLHNQTKEEKQKKQIVHQVKVKNFWDRVKDYFNA